MLKLCWSNYFPLIIPFVVLSGPQVGKAQQQLPVEERLQKRRIVALKTETIFGKEIRRMTRARQLEVETVLQIRLALRS